MWKPEHRRAADRRGLRYPSDLTDAEWELVEPMIPAAKRGGRRRAANVREVLNAIFYVLSTGCQWAALPKDLPPKSTAHLYFMLWEWDGTLERLHHTFYVATRAPSPFRGPFWALTHFRCRLARFGRHCIEGCLPWCIRDFDRCRRRVC
jgi:transposase